MAVPESPSSRTPLPCRDPCNTQSLFSRDEPLLFETDLEVL